MYVFEASVTVGEDANSGFYVAMYFTPLLLQACGNPLTDVGDHVSNRVLLDELDRGSFAGCDKSCKCLNVFQFSWTV